LPQVEPIYAERVPFPAQRTNSAAGPIFGGGGGQKTISGSSTSGGILYGYKNKKDLAATLTLLNGDFEPQSGHFLRSGWNQSNSLESTQSGHNYPLNIGTPKRLLSGRKADTPICAAFRESRVNIDNITAGSPTRLDFMSDLIPAHKLLMLTGQAVARSHGFVVSFKLLVGSPRIGKTKRGRGV